MNLVSNDKIQSSYEIQLKGEASFSNLVSIIFCLHPFVSSSSYGRVSMIQVRHKKRMGTEG